MSKKVCGTCRYWQRASNSPTGLCDSYMGRQEMTAGYFIMSWADTECRWTLAGTPGWEPLAIQEET